MTLNEVFLKKNIINASFLAQSQKEAASRGGFF